MNDVNDNSFINPGQIIPIYIKMVYVPLLKIDFYLQE